MLTLWPRSLVPASVLDGPIRLDAELPPGQHVYVPRAGAVHVEGRAGGWKPSSSRGWRPEGGPRGWKP